MQRRHRTIRSLWCGKRPSDRSADGGFTLLEILVVVAIIAMLVAVLLPSLAAARQQARIVACQSNLRQIAIAWHAYLEANRGYFLKGINTDRCYGGRQGALSAFRRPKPLNRHLNLPAEVEQGAEVYRCPSDDGSEDVRPSHFVCYGTSYEMNRFLVGQDSFHVYGSDPCRDVMIEVRRRIRNLKRDDVGDTARLVLVGDFEWFSTWHFKGKKWADWHKSCYYYNLAFMDGHAQFVHVRKGLSVTPEYTVIPFADLISDAVERQEEVLCE